MFVNDSEQMPQVFIQGLHNLNRAVHDDVVAVELLAESEWTVPTSLVLEEKEDEDVGDFVDAKEEDETLMSGEAKPAPTSKRVPTGRVVGIIKRSWRPYCGVLQVHTF